MSTIRMDNQGVLRHTQGHEGGQFAPKPITAPTEPLSGINDAETLRARVRAMFHQIVAPSSTPAELAGGSRLEEDPSRSGSPSPGPARERILVTSVTIPKIDSAIAPVVVTIPSAPAAGETPHEYREFAGQLYRQVWGVEDDQASRIVPAVPASSAWEPTVPGKTYQLRPVPADVDWLQEQARRAITADPIHAVTVADAEVAAQERLAPFASIDGEVWQATAAPGYSVPLPDTDAPGVLTVRVEPEAALGTPGVFGADDYAGAVAQLHVTAARTGRIAEEPDPEPPIVWFGRQQSGADVALLGASELTVANFRSNFARLREEVAQIPGAVRGDVGSFLSVGSWVIDYSSLTDEQQGAYKAYVRFGVDRGLV